MQRIRLFVAIIATCLFVLPSAGQEEELRQWATEAAGTSQYGTESWSFSQATGAPDTDSCGDIPTAWASATSTGSDTLALAYDVAVIPTQINIYQTYNPGSIIRVEVGNSETEEIFTIPNSADPPGNTTCPGTFTLDVTSVTEPVDVVLIYLDQSIGGNWNEIDAVELVGIPPEGTVVSDSSQQDTPSGDVVTAAWPAANLTAEHPADWVNNTDDFSEGNYLMATSEAAITAFDQNQPIADGEVVISVATPVEISEAFGLDASGSAQTVLEEFSSFLPSASPIETYDNLDVPAAILFVGEDVVPGGAAVIAAERETGTLLFAIATGGDFVQFEEQIVPILNSAAYGSAEEAVVTQQDTPSGEFVTAEWSNAPGLSIQHPTDWVNNTMDAPSSDHFVATSQAAIEAFDNANALPDGEVAINIGLVTELAEGFGADPDAEPAELLESFLAAVESEGEAVSYDRLDVPAAIVELGEGVFPGGAVLIAARYEGGSLFYAITFGGEYAEFEDQIVDVLNTVEYTTGDGSAAATAEAIATPETTDDNLSETYTSEEGGFTIQHPAGWVTYDENPDDPGSSPYLATSQAALDASLQGTPIAEGEIVLAISPPAGFATVLGEPMGAAVELLNALNAQLNDGLQVFGPYDGLDVPAASAFGGADIAPDGLIVLAAEFPDGTYFFTVQPGMAWEEIEPQVVAIINSIQPLGGTSSSDAATEESSPVEPIPAALERTVVWEEQGFSMGLPESWYVNENRPEYIGSTQQAYEAMEFLSTVPQGQVGINIALPTELQDNFGLSTTADPIASLETLSEIGGFEMDIRPYDALDFPAAITEVGDAVIPGGATIIAVQYDTGTLWFAFATNGNFEAYESLFIAMLNSVSYTAP